jgi:hypothetical protein
MAKQRNSLGVIVLPVPYNETITWEEYKKRYGIDLDEIFDSTIIGDGYTVRVKDSVTKLILLSSDKRYLKNNETVEVPLPLVAPDYVKMNADPDDINSGSIDFIWTEANSGVSLMLSVIANKNVYGEFA